MHVAGWAVQKAVAAMNLERLVSLCPQSLTSWKPAEPTDSVCGGKFVLTVLAAVHILPSVEEVQLAGADVRSGLDIVSSLPARSW